MEKYMEEINKEQLKTISDLLVSPTFLIEDGQMTALNEEGRNLSISYDEVNPFLREEDEVVSNKQIVFHRDTEASYFSMSGRKVIYQGRECWIMQIMPIANQETLKNLYRISTARQIMLQMANAFSHVDSDQSVYEFILENCGKAVQHSDLCSLMLAENDIFRIVAKRGYNDDVYNVTFDRNSTFLGMATHGKYDQSVIINDLSKFLNIYHTEIKTESHAQLLGSTLSAPVYVNNKLYAILCFDSEEKNAFAPQDIELLELVKTNVETMLTNHQMQMEILHLSKTDMLTGLFNRTYLKEFLEKHIHERFFVGMFDMNDLKGINDGHGHNNGDLVIRSMAEALRHTFPEKSSYFRLGGDEFMCILYDLTYDEIMNRIASLRNDLLLTPLTLTDGAVTTLSFSCGFSQHDVNEDFETVLSRADHHMYEDKRRIKAFHL